MLLFLFFNLRQLNGNFRILRISFDQIEVTCVGYYVNFALESIRTGLVVD